MRWAGHLARMGGKERCIQGLVEKPGGKRPLGRAPHKGNDDIKMGLKEVGLGDLDWNDLAEHVDRLLALVNALMNFRIP